MVGVSGWTRIRGFTVSKRKSLIAPLSFLLCAMIGLHAFADGLIGEGVGSLECKEITDKIPYGQGWGANGFTQGVMSWFEGFASGLNAMKAEKDKTYFDLSSISVDEQWAYVLDVCRRNPSLDIAHAVDDMMVHRMRLIKVPAPPPAQQGNLEARKGKIP
jgi:hypothetical protein